jgi:hypothetical protein
VPLTAHFYYRKWLRYYLDFCFKYHHDKSKAVSIFYGIKNTDQGKIDLLKNKKENVSTKKLVESSQRNLWIVCETVCGEPRTIFAASLNKP